MGTLESKRGPIQETDLSDFGKKSRISERPDDEISASENNELEESQR